MHSPTERIRPFLINLLGQSQINQRHPPIPIQHKIARLNVPVDDSCFMYLPNNPGNLSNYYWYKARVEVPGHLNKFMQWKPIFSR